MRAEALEQAGPVEPVAEGANEVGYICAIVAVALERYRRAHARWPETLAALTPSPLREVPLDPYDGAPLRYHHRDDGVIVYALGPDGAIWYCVTGVNGGASGEIELPAFFRRVHGD